MSDNNGHVPYSRFEAVLKERNALRDELKTLRREQMTDRAAQLAGLPLQLADRIEGDTLESCMDDARRLKATFGL